MFLVAFDIKPYKAELVEGNAGEPRGAPIVELLLIPHRGKLELVLAPAGLLPGVQSKHAAFG